MANRATKKRKYDEQELERTMYTSFVSAANAVSQLYTQGVQQQRRSASAASRATLEKLLGFVMREYPNSEVVPKAVLLQYLQYEYESIDSQDGAAQSTPVAFLPVIGAQQPAGATGSDVHEQHKLRQQPASLLSPGRRGSLSQQSMEDVAGDHHNMDTGPAASMFMGTGYPAHQSNMPFGQR